jgi:hypothetical protein
MDVAGALGWTMIFPFLIGIGFSIVTAVYWDVNDPFDTHERIVFRRLLYTSTILVIGAVIGWIVAIWMGYAQGAMVT